MFRGRRNFNGQTGTVTYGNESLLRVEGEFTLPSVCDDLSVGLLKNGGRFTTLSKIPVQSDHKSFIFVACHASAAIGIFSSLPTFQALPNSVRIVATQKQ